ncbi:uncharacterized protein PV09_03013 [Verruconis gallopava]|uniref:Histone deacetylase complex subunit SAP30 Sin3 binding domain-containing protein n=1 Tax=Verruconis gallopava TaxID=253628 RepID=A0A0D2B3E3_9PEZI|nr:uncharacterized protein PV09_03013 [Verruconis gallopava]KIW05804.1 hypothetical protein PV09_03013 [Verruconis gallopava]
MAPPKRSAPETSVCNDANLIAKQKLAAQAQLAGRGRRANGNATTDAALCNQADDVRSGSKDLANGSETSSPDQNGSNTGSIDWLQEDRKLLIKYRDAYKLPSASAFYNASAQYILATGIGPRSPTMAREREKRRNTKTDLAAAVRKHFKNTSVAESECLVEVMYRVKTKDKAFRLKFPPKPVR